MDHIDRQILAGLRVHARTTYAELAKLVGLSSASVHERVKRLEERGTILGYTAIVSPPALGLDVCALISVHQTDSAERDEVAMALSGIGAIEDCWSVAGEEAFVVKVRVSDMAALEHVLAALWHLPGVARTRTTVVLSTRWEGRPAALDTSAEEGSPQGDIGSDDGFRTGA